MNLMMKKTIIPGMLATVMLLLASCSSPTEPNSLSGKEKRQGFELLFDGESTDGWRGFRKESFPPKWIIDDGAIRCQASGKGEAGAIDGGDIIYDKKYSNFHLKLEWKIAEGGNSGIFYLGSEDNEFDDIWKAAPEMQVLDNARHPDAQLGKDGNRQAGSLYDIIPADPQNFRGAGHWNQVEVIHENGHVKHIQNGEVVVEYRMGTQEWEDMVAASKFPGYNPGWADMPGEGLIGLQDHGDDVWFRNIKIKSL